MLEKYEVCSGLFHGFNQFASADGSPADRLQICSRRWSTFSRTTPASALPECRARIVAGVRAGGAASRDGPHTRGRVAVPACASGVVEAVRTRRDVLRELNHAVRQRVSPELPRIDCGTSLPRPD